MTAGGEVGLGSYMVFSEDCFFGDGILVTFLEMACVTRCFYISDLVAPASQTRTGANGAQVKR